MSTAFDIKTAVIGGGLSVVEASAGTGKTFSLSYLVPRLLLQDEKLRLGEILLVTFTNDAAGELADRVRQVLHTLWAAAAEDAPPPDHEVVAAFLKEFGPGTVRKTLGRALREVDRLAVMTIHSFCLRVLQTEGNLCGMPVVPELQTDAQEIIEEALADLWEKEIARCKILASLAQSGYLSLEGDQTFVTKALAQVTPEYDPVKSDADALWQRLQDLPREFTEPRQQDLLTLFAAVPQWNTGAPSCEMVKGALATLSKAFDENTLAAAQTVATLPDCVNKRGKAGQASAASLAADAAVSLAREFLELVQQFSWQRRIALVDRLRQEIQQTLRKLRRTTYDDLLGAVHRALTPSGGATTTALATRLRQLYQVALIDESQDTDARQFEIFERIFLEPGTGHRMVLIGDPKQAIYGFRGADVNSYLRAKTKCGAARLYTLNQTYRAPQRLVDCVNTLFRPPHSFLKPGLDFQPATSACPDQWLEETPGENTPSPSMEAWIFPVELTEKSGTRQDALAQAVAAEIARLLSGPAEIVTVRPDNKQERKMVSPGDFAVLVSTGKQAQKVAAALRHLHIPVVLAQSGNVMESDEAADLLVILQAIEEPRRQSLLRTALATRLLGHTMSDLTTSGDTRNSTALAAASEDALLRFLEWQSLWHREGVAALLSRLESDLAVRLARQEAGERRLTNFRHLADLLQAAEATTGRRPSLLVQWLAQASTHPGGEAEERKMQLESDAQAVQIVTMHSAKGLEYPLVFCPFLWHQFDPKGLEALALDNGSTRILELTKGDPRKNQVLRQALEERLRLAYVALTRAKVKAWFVAGVEGGKRSGVPPSAVDWLLCPPTPSASPTDPITEDDFKQWVEGPTAANGGRRQRHQEALAKNYPSLIAVREIQPGHLTASRWQPSLAAPTALQALAPPTIPPWRGLTSFTSLTREKHRHEDSSSPLVESGDSATPPSVVPQQAPVKTVVALAPTTELLAFAQAPGSAKVGSALHEWIEQWDLAADPDPARLRAHLQSYLLPDFANETEAASGSRNQDTALTTERWVGAVGPMFSALRTAILPGLNCTVAEACGVVAASEWKFLLPLTEKLTPERLAEAFAKHGEEEYARLVRNLTFAEVQGFLEGVIDRLAVHKGQWGVIDWKSNKLGATSEAYEARSLLQCAQVSHYYLQTHLYLVALRRFLPAGTPLAGAWLVFLRGLHTGTSRGILHIHPSPALLQALDALF